MGEGYKESMSFMYALCKSGGYVGDLDTPDYIRSEAVYELWDGDLNEDLLRAADAFVSVLEERYHGNGFDFIKDEREPRFGDMVYVTDDQEIVIDLVYGKNVTQGRTFLKMISILSRNRNFILKLLMILTMKRYFCLMITTQAILLSLMTVQKLSSIQKIQMFLQLMITKMVIM